MSIAQELDFMDYRIPVASMFLPPRKIIDGVLIRYLLRPAGLEPTTFGSWRRVDSVEKCSIPMGRVDKLLFCLLRHARVVWGQISRSTDNSQKTCCTVRAIGLNN
jgi:hypothetical protein